MINVIVKTTILISLLYVVPFYSQATEREALLNQYANQNSSQFSHEPFSALRGQTLWAKTVEGDAPNTQRSCTTCHGENLNSEGEHISTNKVIKALAPSINPDSLVDAKKIEKWFKRNCLWTFGRECSPQEKGDVLTYLQNQ